LKRKVGTTLDVLIDAPGVGRSSADAPEIDGVVRFKGGKTGEQGGRTGELVKVKIDRADEHDLHGRML
jgi:ribosomal protein S12 methylthiotransferase